MKKSFFLLTLGTLTALVSLVGCGTNGKYVAEYDKVVDYDRPVVTDKYRTFYEVYVRSFYDLDGNGYGDLRGLASKMDYIHNLGANGIWLMPIHPSISYHKYDVDDYLAIDEQYGTLADFDEMIAAAEEYDIAVILDLVVNHSSARHKWFTSARDGLKTGVCATATADHRPTAECIAAYPTVDYYHFYHTTTPSDTQYHAVPNASPWYYEGDFSSNMPDLNLDNTSLKAEIVDIMEFWLDRGVKGFRLDAVKHYFSDNTVKNSAFLGWLQDEARKIDPDVYFVGEAWNSSLEKEYYRSGLDSFFNFTFAGGTGRTTSLINQGRASGFVETIVSYQDQVKAISETGIIANFLGNHDMQRNANAYAGENKLNKVKMALAANQMITGTSWIYYGEELGMIGASAQSDPNYRTAMPWSDDEEEWCDNPPGSTSAEQVYGKDRDYEYYPGNVAQQLEDPHSILNHLRKATYIRNKYPAIPRGTQQAIPVDANVWECGMLEKTYLDEKLYIVFNFGDEVLNVELSAAYQELTISDTISPNGLANQKKDSSLTLQPWSITILQ